MNFKFIKINNLIQNNVESVVLTTCIIHEVLFSNLDINFNIIMSMSVFNGNTKMYLLCY